MDERHLVHRPPGGQRLRVLLGVAAYAAALLVTLFAEFCLGALAWTQGVRVVRRRWQRG